jgi:hypothetical protein
MDFSHWFLLFCALLGFYNVGVIWFVQLVVYCEGRSPWHPVASPLRDLLILGCLVFMASPYSFFVNKAWFRRNILYVPV